MSGEVHMYADSITPAMAQAIEETERRREKQIAYNTEHGVDPQPLRKKIADVTDMLAREDIDTQELLAGGYRQTTTPTPAHTPSGVPSATGDLSALITQLTEQMHQAAAELQFELAARLRDELSDLKRELRQMKDATS